jgi:hypothetical protein
MRNAGVEATVLWKFIHPAVPANRFHDAAYLKSRLVVLPVHQDLTEENIITMKKAAAPFLDVKPAMGDTRS